MISRKLGEDDLTIPVLYVLFTRGSMRTSDLKANLLSMLNPTGHNLDPLVNRNDTAIHQIVRNIVSHRDQATNIINQGYINYDVNTGVLSITQLGVRRLDNFIINDIINYLR